MKSWNAARFLCVLAAFIIFYFLVAAKLFYWQIVRGEDLARLSRDQSTESLEEEAKRGDILSKDNFPLATNKYTYLLYANPKVVQDKKEYAEKLSKTLALDEASLSAQLSKNLFWVKISDGLEEDEREKIENLRLDGLGFSQNSKRYYPEASAAASLLGFVGKDGNGKPHGYFGLEGYYNAQLSGRAGRLSVIRDALGNTILNDVREEKKIDGRTLVLALDRSVQYAIEKRLKEGMETYQAEGGSVVVAESATGKILGMASFPSFDPQKYYESPADSYKNPIVSSLYEPGSTFKVLVMAAGIDTGRVTPEARCDICSGAVEISGYTIKTWNDKYFPNSTMTDVIVHSDNTGMIFVGKKLGTHDFLKYIKSFGIGDTTGIDLQGEASGELREEREWRPIDLATAAFGQGISVTPIELVTAVSAIANGGNLVTPSVVSKIITEDGRVIEIKPEIRHRVISEKTAKIVTWMMVNAVENGEAKWTKIKDYKIAGKTGTAQIPVAGHYDPNETIASFVGFFPADNPKISMLVLLHRPKTSIYGAETAAPIFFNIARDLIQYYNIPPSN